ncbi:hypothetical protein R2E44_004880 [Klebsiella pneumoniae]|nr:hypothetical protein [Klebsiella pneumoniae]ELT5799256.1 hypothetical protein [Klebsiella pneumoniae]
MPYPAYESSAGSNSVGPRKRSAAGQRVIERSSMKSPDAEKQKPAFWAGSLNSGAGLGIEHHHTSLIYMIKNCLWYFLPTCFYQQIIAYVNLNQ